jgi:hypothetical protein
MSRRFTYEEMTPEELRLALKRLGLSPAAFARICGTQEDRFDEMLRGRRKVPQALRTIAVLLTLPGALAIAEEVTASVASEDTAVGEPSV